ncbi:dTDP-4-amino-4,6-dideoxygalactose transaminase [Plantibacter flavus]|uniref:dTDP-4-amino-4,6-dideoxygalactose transaminase n=1 Tax=Plantibacter flavus TaxID=150123 RepID=UPI003F17C83A
MSAGPKPIPLSRPYRAAGELENLEQVLASDHAHGDGRFTVQATERLRDISGAPDVLLTTSGTHALEMSTRLIGAGPGDEIILPSFTFPSAANAIVLAGATPVFVDIDPATGNLDPNSVQEAIGPRTRAISIMHYGGVPADVTALECIARDAGILILEDNAHGLGVQGQGVRLGTIGVTAAQSFHDTKNIHCGEGGALLINDPTMLLSAEIMREKGTNRSQYLRGQVDKYSWAQIGSSYLPSELNAAVLTCQLAEFDTIQTLRHRIWDRYASELAAWADAAGVALMDPPGGLHAAHLFFLLLPSPALQREFLEHLHRAGIGAAFHYVPLHTSAAGQLYGRTPVALDRSERFAERLVRLPLWPSMSDDDVDRVIAAVTAFTVPSLLRSAASRR